jgi:hypothetical protein
MCRQKSGGSAMSGWENFSYYFIESTMREASGCRSFELPGQVEIEKLLCRTPTRIPSSATEKSLQ